MDAISSIFGRKSQKKEAWLEEQTRNFKFVVLLFYRGKWGLSMWDYLNAFVTMVPHLRAQGGEFVVVVPKSKSEKKKMEKHFNSAFKVITDSDNVLAHKFKITTHKKESKVYSLLHSPSTTITNNPMDKRHSMSLFSLSAAKDLFHFAHPGVLVISGTTTREGEWTTKRTIKNHYDVDEHFTPAGLRDLLDLHFGKPRRT